MISVLGENLEDLQSQRNHDHQELEYQRSARQTAVLLNCPGGILEDQQEELEVNGLLEKLPTHDNQHVRWHSHQLFRQLRGGKSRAKRTGWARDPRHCDNLHGNHSVEEHEHVHQLVHGTSRTCTTGAKSASCSTVCRGTLRPRLGERLGPPPAGVFVVQFGRPPAGEGGLPELGREVRLVPLPPGSSPASVPEHCDG